MNSHTPIPQSIALTITPWGHPSITGTLPLDCLVSYPGHSWSGGSYSSAEKQSVYSTAPADWANPGFKFVLLIPFLITTTMMLRVSKSSFIFWRKKNKRSSLLCPQKELKQGLILSYCNDFITPNNNVHSCLKNSNKHHL